MASGNENVGGRLVRWEGGRVMRLQGGKGGRVVRSEGEVPGFIKEWGTQGESKILSFCFQCQSREQRGGLMLIKGTKRVG